MDIKNLSIVRQSFANTVFTHKAQEAAAENAGEWVFWIKVANIGIVTFAFIMLLLQVANPSNIVFSHIASGVAAGENISLTGNITL